MDSLVDVGWLKENFDDPQLRIIDCSVLLDQAEDGSFSFVSGETAWRTGHIPGSVFADLLKDGLSDTDNPLPFTLPSAEKFSPAMSALGVGSGTRAVLYDRANNMWATRLWWMLRGFGFDDAAILDGGWTAWTQASAPVDASESTYPPAEFHASPRKNLFVNAQDVLRFIDDPKSQLIDALSPEMFRGEAAPYPRLGHIPGAVNVYAMEIVDPQTMRYLDETRLRELFTTAFDQPEKRAVTYCGVGVGATSAAFTLHRLGHKNISVYDGSLAEWSANPSLPMVTED